MPMRTVVNQSSIWLNLALALICLSLPATTQRQCIAQQGHALSSDQQVALNRFLVEHYQITHSAPPTRTLSVSVDLNNDGSPETVVYLIGNDWCGSGGCTMLILTTETGYYKVITKTTITRLPVRLLNTRTRGWSDIAVTVQGGGIMQAYEARLRFNGKKYPSNPTVPPAQRLSPHTPGTTLIPVDAYDHAIPVYP
jgi:hypothetical protein